MSTISDEYIKKIEIDILRDVVDFCQKNDIEYYLIFGSLLGAVRHKGFIPWDDDIDIAMPRAAYKKFVQIYKHSCYKVVDSVLYSDYPYAFAKVMDTGTELKECTNSSFPLGIYVDVFPIDALPDDKNKEKKYLKKAKMLCLISRYKLIDYRAASSVYKKICQMILKLLLLPFSQKYIISLQNKHAELYNENYVNCRNVCMPTILAGGRVYPKECFGEETVLKFEDCVCRVPQNYDLWLKIQYGDYMKLPPEEKRVSHHSFTVKKIGE